MKTNFIERYEDKPIYKDKRYLPVLVTFIFIFGLIGYTLYVDGNSIDLRTETSFIGTVEKTFYQKSTYYIKLSSMEKWLKLENFRNESYPELDFNFMSIIEKGDSIVKKVNSDTIELIRPERKYYFRIEKYFD
tara:strand:- start:497 stop:895 length:399 start_codon:yes stop_codon:yes gene_type:complete